MSIGGGTIETAPVVSVMSVLNKANTQDKQKTSKQIEMGLGACDIRCIRMHYVPGRHLTKVR